MAAAGNSMTQPAAPSRTTLPLVRPAPAAGAKIDYELFLDCVHCGLCTASCPTYLETGHEADSPRGRIYLMRAVTDGKLDLNADVRGHLDLCLDCRACETACPSGVQYGRLIEPFRMHMTKTLPDAKSLPWLQRFVLNSIFPYNLRNRLALAPARWMQWLGLDKLLQRTGLIKLLPRSLRQMHEMLPRLKPHYGRLPELLPAEGPRRAKVGLFVGCVADAVFPETTLSTARVLQKNGCDVWIPRSQGCCGALHYHSAQEEPARRFAQANCSAFGFGDAASDLDAVIVNAAGCGAMLKDYRHLLHDSPAEQAGERFTAKVRDVSEFLADLGPVKPTHPLKMKAAYHDACHLCHAQQIRKPPRQLLEMIPELTLVPLAESEVCCGAAGSYNLTQPDMAGRLGQRKVQNILTTGAEAVFMGNVGCLLQIERHLRAAGSPMWVAHPIDALWASYSRKK
jgi:glycolate oxidase iron-sulfur subunit